MNVAAVTLEGLMRAALAVNDAAVRAINSIMRTLNRQDRKHAVVKRRFNSWTSWFMVLILCFGSASATASWSKPVQHQAAAQYPDHCSITFTGHQLTAGVGSCEVGCLTSVGCQSNCGGCLYACEPGIKSVLDLREAGRDIPQRLLRVSMFPSLYDTQLYRPPRHLN